MIVRLLAFLRGLLWWRKDDTLRDKHGFEVPNTREWRRQIVKSQRLRGAGYTRQMRKGRTQRERP